MTGIPHCNTKLTYLNSVERHEAVECNIDESKPKYFITFPYPYMNGKLHLGHLYSVTKADFTAYFKRIQGYNVLFPFSFHCTGMPISASASKLSQELSGKKVDVSVINILKSFGFEDARPFKDPKHWIYTFPAYAKETLQQFHSCIDWRRSFITTDENVFYDSFVRYQFNKLRKLGLLSFGKRYSIFCTVDNQACLDHDRRKGEGIKSKEVMLRKVKCSNGTLLLRVTGHKPVKKVVLSRSEKLKVFSIAGRTFISDAWLFENIRYQVEHFIGVDEIFATNIHCDSCVVELTDAVIPPRAVFDENNSDNQVNDEFVKLSEYKNEELKIVESEHFAKFCEPEGPVISRAGSNCVVSLLDQWFIDYSNEEWKSKVRECVASMELTSDTRVKLEDAISWINKWGFSRSFGLGTHIPWDKQYLIDSLSDSTIYMALYTVKHHLFSDMYGKQPIFPPDKLTYSFWQYIFEDIDLPSNLDLTDNEINIIKQCRSSFQYFYPVDLRVSGKDLIGNHLIFFIFNHVALFPKRCWPRRIFTNGHVMLNSEKMSKSEGNFLSAEDALAKYGASATRMCLAFCCDTNEDANFEESTVNSFVLKLYTLVKSVESLDDSICQSLTSLSSTDLIRESLTNLSLQPETYFNLATFSRNAFIQIISFNIRSAISAYESMAFRDVVKYAFFENLHLVELYQSLGGSSQQLICLAYKITIQLIYPLVPSLCNYLLNLKFNGDISLPSPITDKTDMLKAVEFLRELVSRIITGKKDRNKAEIKIANKYSEWRTECMQKVDELRASCGQLSEKATKQEIVKQTRQILEMHKVKGKLGLLFCMDYFNNPARYAINFNAYEISVLCHKYIENRANIPIKLVGVDFGDPNMPDIIFN